MSKFSNLDIAVLVPCFNEAISIEAVVWDFAAVLPGVPVYVYDNNSTDDTVAVARAAGAIVRTEPLQGKGNVVRRMLSDISADIYVMVDGDDTYDVASAPALIEKMLDEQLDMVVGARVTDEKAAYRAGHRFGNALLTRLVGAIFETKYRDMLSGYRVFSRRFAKSFPALSAGFEIETELNVHAHELRMKVVEVDTPYKERPEGSESKLSTFKDGWRILKTIAQLMKEERPMEFFGFIFMVLAFVSIILMVPVAIEFLDTGLVPRFPTAILSMGTMLLAFLSLTCGFILDTVTTGRREIKRLAYLVLPPPEIEKDSAARSTDD